MPITIEGIQNRKKAGENEVPKQSKEKIDSFMR
jgi:hypothetical protein